MCILNAFELFSLGKLYSAILKQKNCCQCSVTHFSSAEAEVGIINDDRPNDSVLHFLAVSL